MRTEAVIIRAPNDVPERPMRMTDSLLYFLLFDALAYNDTTNYGPQDLRRVLESGTLPVSCDWILRATRSVLKDCMAGRTCEFTGTVEHEDAYGNRKGIQIKGKWLLYWLRRISDIAASTKFNKGRGSYVSISFLD